MPSCLQICGKPNLAKVLWGMVTFQSHYEAFACTMMKTVQINII
jgi:hypothetical protein